MSTVTMLDYEGMKNKSLDAKGGLVGAVLSLQHVITQVSL